jgi:hypothetical protein
MAAASGAASPLVLDALVLQHLHQRFPQAAEALRKELDARQAEQAQPAVVAPKQRQALLTLLASANRDEPMWATSYAETRDWIDVALDLYKVRRLPCAAALSASQGLRDACRRGPARAPEGRAARRLDRPAAPCCSLSCSGCCIRSSPTRTSR